MQRKVLTPNDFPDLDAVGQRPHAFAGHYEQPCAWEFTRHDLHALLDRIDKRRPA